MFDIGFQHAALKTNIGTDTHNSVWDMKEYNMCPLA